MHHRVSFVIVTVQATRRLAHPSGGQRSNRRTLEERVKRNGPGSYTAGRVERQRIRPPSRASGVCSRPDRPEFEIVSRRVAVGRTDDVSGRRRQARVEVKDDAIHGKDTDSKKMEFDQRVSNGGMVDKGEVGFDVKGLRRTTEVEVESFGH